MESQDEASPLSPLLTNDALGAVIGFLTFCNITRTRLVCRRAYNSFIWNHIHTIDTSEWPTRQVAAIEAQLMQKKALLTAVTTFHSWGVASGTVTEDFVSFIEYLGPQLTFLSLPNVSAAHQARIVASLDSRKIQHLRASFYCLGSVLALINRSCSRLSFLDMVGWPDEENAVELLFDALIAHPTSLEVFELDTMIIRRELGQGLTRIRQLAETHPNLHHFNLRFSVSSLDDIKHHYEFLLDRPIFSDSEESLNEVCKRKTGLSLAVLRLCGRSALSAEMPSHPLVLPSVRVFSQLFEDCHGANSLDTRLAVMDAIIRLATDRRFMTPEYKQWFISKLEAFLEEESHLRQDSPTSRLLDICAVLAVVEIPHQKSKVLSESQESNLFKDILLRRGRVFGVSPLFILCQARLTSGKVKSLLEAFVDEKSWTSAYSLSVNVLDECGQSLLERVFRVVHDCSSILNHPSFDPYFKDGDGNNVISLLLKSFLFEAVSPPAASHAKDLAKFISICPTEHLPAPTIGRFALPLLLSSKELMEAFGHRYSDWKALIQPDILSYCLENFLLEPLRHLIQIQCNGSALKQVLPEEVETAFRDGLWALMLKRIVFNVNNYDGFFDPMLDPLREAFPISREQFEDLILRTPGFGQQGLQQLNDWIEYFFDA